MRLITNSRSGGGVVRWFGAEGKGNGEMEKKRESG
jgi:hypothetical protein